MQGGLGPSTDPFSLSSRKSRDYVQQQFETTCGLQPNAGNNLSVLLSAKITLEEEKRQEKVREEFIDSAKVQLLSGERRVFEYFVCKVGKLKTWQCLNLTLPSELPGYGSSHFCTCYFNFHSCRHCLQALADLLSCLMSTRLLGSV